ncbi:CBS domain-containing protein [Paraferrimonas sedimenticola]|uniref:CBS domain-containing protein n=1 Tax=Paraferrimonas sedimenticola TaxID=375674 RepID=A0AA37VWW3_9GAMM|nr:CBS domain-containing protein [Paraferrimonas sedimenticola]GLP95080.1 CBS domain-containing protein [Paraferrimonas sedimenticola]
MNQSENLVRVLEVMSQDYALVDGMNTIAEAIEVASKANVQVLLVNKRHEDDEFGMVLMSDIAKQVVSRDRAPERVNVYEIMIKPVLSVRGRMDVRYCARLFERFGIHTAPVIDEDQIQGVVNYQDIVLKGMSSR